MVRDELVESVDRRSSSDEPKEPPHGPSTTHFCEKRDAASSIARYERRVAQDEPPAIVPLARRDVRKQPGSRLVVEREKGKLVPTIEPCDDTRREPAELSGARVEQRRA